MMRLIDRYFLKQPRLRYFVTRLLEGDREYDVPLLGTTLRVHSIKEHGYLRSSRRVSSSALLREELPVMLNLTALFGPGDTFVDIGANVGVYSHTLSRLAGILPGVRFYAFEANPDTFQRLQKNAEARGVQVFNVALADHAGSLEFVAGGVSHVFTTAENTTTPGERVSVPCQRLDAMPIEGDSLVMKIDVEGQEKGVLDGATGLFQANRVKAVYLDGYKDRAVETFLKERGFTLLHGKTLEPTEGGVFHLLAVRRTAEVGNR